ncbi:RNA polymerase sigma factor [Laspinema sp. D1]|uniref:RNA polymerase sigma factor n=1 Tax=Laspinema palackyanum TaxID=3231601 RepID=UPI00346E39B5|nr:RNA polymerase sigma factor [Laspinema sp. D2b]
MVQTTTNPIANRAEEQQLLHRLAAGETHAFWQLFQKCRDYLFRCCLKWTNGNSTEAEDLLSQAMVKALDKAQKYAGEIENFKSWLTTLTRNFWLDLKRRGGTISVEDIEVYGEQHELGLVSVDQTPDRALEEDDKKRVIRAAIDELANWLRETFILHYYQGLSNQEIAERQEISGANVRQRISRARKILALELRGYFIDDTATESDTATVAPKPAKSNKAAKKPAETEELAAKTVTVSEAVEEAGAVVEEPQETALSVHPIDTRSGWQKSLLKESAKVDFACVVRPLQGAGLFQNLLKRIPYEPISVSAASDGELNPVVSHHSDGDKTRSHLDSGETSLSGKMILEETESLARSHTAQTSEWNLVVSYHFCGEKALSDRGSRLDLKMRRSASWKRFYEMQGVSKIYLGEEFTIWHRKASNK